MRCFIGLGLQGEDSGHKGRNSAKKTGREAAWGHNLAFKSMVAITFQVAISNCEFETYAYVSCVLLYSKLTTLLYMYVFVLTRRKTRQGWCRKQGCN